MCTAVLSTCMLCCTCLAGTHISSVVALLLCMQVMDPKKATNEKVVKERKPDHTLISFFGDDSYGWFPTGRDILPFDKHFAAKSKQPASKKVQLSMFSPAPS